MNPTATLRKLSERFSFEPSPWWFLPPTAFGLLVLMVTVAVAPGAERVAHEANRLAVRVMTVEASSVQPTLTGFGEVRAQQQWQGVVQVPGKVTWRHPQLESGATFSAGTQLLTLDTVDYEVARSQAQAQLQRALAQQAEVDKRAADLKRSIAIEARALELARSRFSRNQDLSTGGHISQVQLDGEERELLRQEQTLQNLTTEQNLIPTQLSAAQAQVEEARASLAKAEEDIARTVLTMPFDGRVTMVEAETAQFLPAGRAAFTVESTDAVEVLLEVPYEQLMARFPSIMGDPQSGEDGYAELSAEVFYRTPLGEQTWLGRVNRIDPGLNAASRSARVFVQVDLEPGQRPPAANLFLEVTIQGPTLFDHIIIPRLAWRNGAVLVVDEDNLLRRRDAELAFAEDDRAVLRRGLSSGERVILTDVLFPTDGLPVLPYVEEAEL